MTAIVGQCSTHLGLGVEVSIYLTYLGSDRVVRVVAFLGKEILGNAAKRLEGAHARDWESTYITNITS